MLSRLRALLTTAAFALLPVLALAPPAHADSHCVAVICPSDSPSPSPSATPTADPTPTPSKTRSPRPTSTRTSSPRPRATFTSSAPRATQTETGEATPTAVVTSAAPTLSPLPAAQTEKAGANAQLNKLAALVVAGAVLLGAGGAAGLYLTRTKP